MLPQLIRSEKNVVRIVKYSNLPNCSIDSCETYNGNNKKGAIFLSKSLKAYVNPALMNEFNT
jgi:hypothetical protein|tara:strand:+ start:190 stop:375 length:186 start_codon:yes stop_codon:yes gene_type:complete